MSTKGQSRSSKIKPTPQEIRKVIVRKILRYIFDCFLAFAIVSAIIKIVKWYFKKPD